MVVAGLYMKKFLLICFLFSFYELALNYGTGFATLDRGIKLLARFIGLKIFKFSADTSYGVYLIHVPLLILVIRLLTLETPFTGFSPAWRFLACLAVVFPLAYALAFLAHRYIESPGIDWGRNIIKRMGRKRS